MPTGHVGREGGRQDLPPRSRIGLVSSGGGAEAAEWAEALLASMAVFLFWTGLRHGEAAALRWNDLDLMRGILSISRSRDEGEDNAPKTTGSTREIPMLRGVVDLLKRLPRRLHSDGSEFVLLSPEGKPMTDAWWPKRGAARRPVDDESKGIWFRCLRSLGIRPRKFYMTRHSLSRGRFPRERT